MAGLYIEMPEEPSSRRENHSFPPSRDRIAYLISQYPTLSHSFILREIQEMRGLGVKISVASIRRPDRPLDQLSPEEKEEVRTTYYVRDRAWRWMGLHLRMLARCPTRYVSTLVFALRTSRGDFARSARHLRFFGESVVVAEWARDRELTRLHTHFASMTAVLTARLLSVSLSMTIHGSDEFIDPLGFCMAEKLRVTRLAIGISRYGCSQIMRFCDPKDWEKVAMVRLGINPDDFEPVVEHECHDTFHVICVGRLVPVKAHRYLLHACAQLIAKGQKLHLTIVGGGPELQSLIAFAEELRIAEHVEFAGALPNPEVRDRVRHSDCFALASFAEGVPVVLMEAMALGVPCVATRVTGVPELIADGVEGLLVAPADAEAMADAIGRLMHDPELYKSVARAARTKVLDEYDLRKNVRDLRDYLFEKK